MRQTPDGCGCPIHFCCPLPEITAGPVETTPPGTAASVTVVPTPCGARLDFSIPQGPEGPGRPASYASFVTLLVPFVDRSPIVFGTGVPDPTGRIVQTSDTQITLMPGTYWVSYQVSAILETAGYLQITPAYNGQGFLQYGVYSRTAADRATASGGASFIAVVPEETVLTLNANTDTAAGEGAMTMVIQALA